MGTTGSSENVAMNTALPDIISRVRQHATVPIAVGFGVATREHFNTVADAGADGVVIGSRLVTVMKNSSPQELVQNVQSYCQELRQKDRPSRVRLPPAPPASSTPDDSSKKAATVVPGSTSELPARFGQFGGQYVPEALVDCLIELEEAHKSAMVDPEFWKEFQSYFGYMNRPSKFYFAENLTKDAGGARIWLKREDLYA